MARKPRIHVPGGVYHVMLRGNGGQSIFTSDGDRYFLEQLVAEGVERFGYRVHAYCWMQNHVHLVIQVGEIPLSKIVQNISFRYTRYVNKKENRVGHLFQGRYKAILVDGDGYLAELVRYVHLNPVRASLVNDPSEYKWSGQRAYLKLSESNWLTCEGVLSTFAKREKTAIKRYNKYILEGVGKACPTDFQKGAEGGRVLGDDQFIAKVLATNKEVVGDKVVLEDLVRQVCKYYEMPEKHVLSLSRARDCVFVRNVISFLWVDKLNGQLKKWADYCGKDLSSLSRNLTAFKMRGQDYGSGVEEILNNTITQA